MIAISFSILNAIPYRSITLFLQIIIVGHTHLSDILLKCLLLFLLIVDAIYHFLIFHIRASLTHHNPFLSIIFKFSMTSSNPRVFFLTSSLTF